MECLLPAAYVDVRYDLSMRMHHNIHLYGRDGCLPRASIRVRPAASGRDSRRVFNLVDLIPAVV